VKEELDDAGGGGVSDEDVGGFLESSAIVKETLDDAGGGGGCDEDAGGGASELDDAGGGFLESPAIV
jgi:hypothetical protein